jgi:calcium-dependent protein kinase
LEANKNFNDIKLVDFGNATKFKKGECFSELFGTPYYVAPEVLNENYGEKADMWSIGVIAFMLLSGGIPFTGKTIGEIFNSIKKGEFSMDEKPWEKVSESAKDFVAKLLKIKVKQRMSVTDALAHKWI